MHFFIDFFCFANFEPSGCFQSFHDQSTTSTLFSLVPCIKMDNLTSSSYRSNISENLPHSHPLTGHGTLIVSFIFL